MSSRLVEKVVRLFSAQQTVVRLSLRHLTIRPRQLSSSGASPSYSSQYWTLHELVSSGQYDRAIDVWEQSKAGGQMDPHSYTVVMAMCQRLGSVAAALAVRDDMQEQRISMDAKCALHFVNTLITNGSTEMALDHIQQSASLKSDPTFLSRLARSLLSQDRPELAKELCALALEHSDCLLCVQLECLGSLGRWEELHQLIEMCYGGLKSAPHAVQLSLVGALSLADQYIRAMDLLTEIADRGDYISPRAVCLLLESIRRAGDVTMASKVFSLCWEQTYTIKESQLSMEFTQSTLTAIKEDRDSCLLRAANACIMLQALSAKGTPTQAHNTELRKFLDYDFYSFLRAQSVYPDSQTYEVLLLKACFDEGAVGVTDRAIKSLYQSGSPLTSNSFVGWTRYCGPLSTLQANRVLPLIRRHFLARYNVTLTTEDYQQLLEVELVWGADPGLLSEALSYVRTIKNAMLSQGVLSTTEHWNTILASLVRLDAGDGPLFITYDDMTTQGVDPDVHTYKIIAEGAVTKRACRTAVFDWWRLFNSKIQPDIELMNTLMKCCVVCEEHERAFLFFGLLKDYQLQPNMTTFETLFKVCASTGDMERLSTLADVAMTMLPQQVDRIQCSIASSQETWTDSQALNTQSQNNS